MRPLTRYRMQLMGDRTRESIRLELMLQDASSNGGGPAAGTLAGAKCRTGPPVKILNDIQRLGAWRIRVT